MILVVDDDPDMLAVVCTRPGAAVKEVLGRPTSWALEPRRYFSGNPALRMPSQ